MHRGSHLRNNATVKLDGVPNGSDAPRSSLRCYAGESCDWRHPVPCLSVHLSVRSHTRTQHICFPKRIARPLGGNSSIFTPPPPWYGGTGRTVTSEGCELCSPSAPTDGRESRRHLSTGGDLRPMGGPPYHSFSEA